jgi:L-fucose isomerase-like protein
MEDINLKKSTFGVIAGTRGFFNPVLAREGRQAVTDKLKAMGHSCIVLDESDTKYGCVETREDAAKCARLFQDHKDEIDGIIITLPNFGDESGATESVKFSGLDVPVLVHGMHLMMRSIRWTCSIAETHYRI